MKKILLFHIMLLVAIFGLASCSSNSEDEAMETQTDSLEEVKEEALENREEIREEAVEEVREEELSATITNINTRGDITVSINRDKEFVLRNLIMGVKGGEKCSHEIFKEEALRIAPGKEILKERVSTINVPSGYDCLENKGVILSYSFDVMSLTDLEEGIFRGEIIVK